MTFRTVFLFSGQGSQYYQMGKALYEAHPGFRRHMDSMDAVVGDLAGYSVTSALYGDRSKGEPFTDIHLTHPAIFMVEFALAQILIEANIEPDLTLGSSLGSVAAAAVSGCICMEDALALVLQQAAIFRAQCDGGGMIAVLANPKLFESEVLRTKAAIASYNFASHFVISARQEHLHEIESFLQTANVVFQRIPVPYPFHSEWIDNIKPLLLTVSRSVKSRDAQIPLICCASGRSLMKLPDNYFWSVIREPILFAQTIAGMEQDGPYQYLDLSPSGTLATFIKYLLPESSRPHILSTLSPYGRDLDSLGRILASRQ